MLLLVAGAALALQLPEIQRGLAEKALDSLQSKTKASISFSDILITPFNSLTVKNLLIYDPEPFTEDCQQGADTVFFAPSLTASFSLKTLRGDDGIYIRRMSIDGGLLNLSSETDPDYRNNIARLFGLKYKVRKEYVPGPPVFKIGRIELKDFTFSHRNFRKKNRQYRGQGINWEHFRIEADIRGRDFSLAGSIFSGICERMEMTETYSGYHIGSCSGKAHVGMGQALVEDFDLTDDWSHLRMPRYVMNFSNKEDFKDFINKVVLDADITRSRLSMKTVCALSGALPGNDMSLDIGKISAKGRICDMTVNELKFTEEGSGIGIDAAASFSGLPGISALRLSSDIRELTFTTSALEKILAEASSGKEVPSLGRYAPDVPFSLSARCDGRLNGRTAVKATLHSSIGTLSAEADIRNLLSGKDTVRIAATLEADDFDLGRLTGNGRLGGCSFGSSAEISFSDITEVRLDSLMISRLNAFGYDYSGIMLSGTFDGTSFDGNLGIDDPGLKAGWSGNVSIPAEGRSGISRFTLDIPMADLHALKLDKREGPSGIAARIRSEFFTDEAGHLSGKADINDIKLTDRFGEHELGDIALRSTNRNGASRLSMDSRFARIRYNGEDDILGMFDEIKRLTAGKALPALCPDSNGRSASERNLKIQLYDTEDICAFISPGLYIEKGTDAYIGISDNGDLGGYLHSGLLAKGNDYIKDAVIDFDNQHSGVSMNIEADEMSIASLGFGTPALNAFARDNSLSVKFKYSGKDDRSNMGEIYLDGSCFRDGTDTLTVKAHPLRSKIIYNGGEWTLEESEIVYRAGELNVKDFKLTNGCEMLHVNGGIKRHSPDTIRIDVRQLDIDIANALTKGKYNFGGIANGKAALISPTADAMALIAGFRIDSLGIGDIPAGDVIIGTGWNESDGVLGLHVRNVLDTVRILNADAYYTPKSKAIKGTVNFDGMDLSIAKPFTNGLFSDMGGKIEGKIIIGGSLDKLSVSSEGARFTDANVTPAFTGVRYTVNGPFSLESDEITFEKVKISDDEGGTAIVDGSLFHKHFTDPEVDLSVLMRNFMALDKRESADALYGKLFASGSATLSGPLKRLSVSGDVSTAKTGNIHLCVNGGGGVRSNDLLTFKEPVRELSRYETMLQKVSSGKKKNSGVVSVNARLNLTRGVDATIELGRNTGNIISIAGSGSVHADIQPSKGIRNFNGQYDIDEGNLHFAMLGSLVAKDFAVVPGSSIKFNGDIRNTQFDITTVHSLKTSLSPLLSGSTDISARRDVNCGIKFTDYLQNPRISFSIEIPDLDPATKTMVEGALNTEDKVQKQFVALLLTRTFIPNEQSGVYYNNSNMLYSNLSNIMSGQLNNILQKLDIPLDLGLNYLKDEAGTDIFDVAVSTQLFHNKVIVGGSLGNRQFSKTRSDDNVVGNLDVEVKLDDSGNLRLKAFSHAVDSYTSFIDNSQRNGIGLSYQREYSRFGEIFKKNTQRTRSSRNEKTSKLIITKDNE